MDRQNERFKKVEAAVIAAVGEFSDNYQSLRNSFTIFNPSNGLLSRLESVFDWDIYTKHDSEYVKIESDYDKKEAAAAMSTMPKLGIVALNDYLEAFIHKLLNETFDALYQDFTRQDLETFTWPDKLPFLANDAQVLLPKNLPSVGKLDKLTEKLVQHKLEQLKALSQPNWCGNLDKKLAELFVAPVEVKTLIEKLLKVSNPLVWNWQFEDSSGRHKDLVAPRDVETFASMSNFFYGVRCLIAHGDPKRTTYSGALKSGEPTCNYKIICATNYLIDNVDEIHLENRERSKYRSVEANKSFGYNYWKRVVTVQKSESGIITEVTQESVTKQPNGDLKMKRKGERTLDFFDKFLDDRTEREAVKKLQAHCKDLWKKARDNELLVDFDLFLSIANFNVYYVRMIALLCLGLCHSVIYGVYDNHSSFLRTVPAVIERLQAAP